MSWVDIIFYLIVIKLFNHLIIIIILIYLRLVISKALNSY